MWTRLRRDGTIGGHGKRGGVCDDDYLVAAAHASSVAAQRARDMRCEDAVLYAWLKLVELLSRSYRYPRPSAVSVESGTDEHYLCGFVPCRRSADTYCNPREPVQSPDTSASCRAPRYGSAKAAPGRDHGAPCAAHRTSDSERLLLVT